MSCTQVSCILLSARHLFVSSSSRVIVDCLAASHFWCEVNCAVHSFQMANASNSAHGHYAAVYEREKGGLPFRERALPGALLALNESVYISTLCHNVSAVYTLCSLVWWVTFLLGWVCECVKFHRPCYRPPMFVMI